MVPKTRLLPDWDSTFTAWTVSVSMGLGVGSNPALRPVAHAPALLRNPPTYSLCSYVRVCRVFVCVASTSMIGSLGATYRVFVHQYVRHMCSQHIKIQQEMVDDSLPGSRIRTKRLGTNTFNHSAGSPQPKTRDAKNNF